MTLVENHFLILIIWEYASKPFMNVKKILHVILVNNYFVILITWGKTIMKIKKISNVTLVQNNFLILIIWEYTSKPFMNVKKISNVILVEKHFLILITWQYTSRDAKWNIIFNFSWFWMVSDIICYRSLWVRVFRYVEFRWEFLGKDFFG